MRLLDPTYIAQVCDYSFGDQSGQQCGICTIKDANSTNVEFLSKVEEVRQNRNYMTLFIDNIRLYNRPLGYSPGELASQQARDYKDMIIPILFKSDLLKLCSEIPDMNFIIFTGFEDTPIDDYIFDNIPSNVIKVYAANSISFGGKVVPIPYGIKRKMHQYDNNQEILANMVGINVEPSGLIYLNHSMTNLERIKVKEYFSNQPWATIGNLNHSNNGYQDFLNDIKRHKFVICPDGNAVGCECHRDWEVLYMRRVPVLKDSVYVRKIFEGYPVLFLNDFCDVTEELLINNMDLFEKASQLDYFKLDIETLYQKYVEDAVKII